MPSARHRRTALKCPAPSAAQGPASPGPKPTPSPAPNNDLFQEFMQTCIKKVRDQAPAALAIPATPATEAKDDVDRFFQPRNPDLYYGY